MNSDLKRKKKKAENKGQGNFLGNIKLKYDKVYEEYWGSLCLIDNEQSSLCL